MHEGNDERWRERVEIWVREGRRRGGGSGGSGGKYKRGREYWENCVRPVRLDLSECK